MRAVIALALLAGATLSHAQTSPKKELVARLLQLQQSGIENVARGIAERPAAQLLQAAGAALQQQPADKREALGKAIEADVKKYVDEAVPLLRDRAVKLAPSTYGVGLEEKFSEDELKQLIAWHESPVSRKYQQAAPELQNTFAQKLVGEAGPLLDPKILALQTKIGTTLGIAAPAPAASGARPAAATPRPASAPRPPGK